MWFSTRITSLSAILVVVTMIMIESTCIAARPTPGGKSIVPRANTNTQTASVLETIRWNIGATGYYNLFNKHSQYDRSLAYILDDGPATIFVPSNDAVNGFPWPDKNEDQIDILRHHIIIGEQIDYTHVRSNDLQSYQSAILTPFSSPLVVHNRSNTPRVNCARILRPPIKVKNTTIYLIDMVISPNNGHYNMATNDNQCSSGQRLSV
ncbi:hypothetical protein BDF22DRAFT_697138 [Syncephalis plumigaleata]|nr:hypothetical protein BDF22DRAFT_697138 [Syncephalis plumigaleata]